MKLLAFLGLLALTGCNPVGGPVINGGLPDVGLPVADAAALDAAAPDAEAPEAPLGGVLLDIRSVAPCNCEHSAACVSACRAAEGLDGPLAAYDRRFWELRFYPVAQGPTAPLGLPADHDVTATGPALAGACRDDRLFIHFPAADFPEVPAFPLADFQDALAPALRGWWFEGEDAPDPRPGRDARWLRLSAAGRCAAVAAVRAAAESLAPGARVGRVCELAPSLVPEIYAGPAVDWHLRRIDARVPPHQPGEAQPAPPALPEAGPAGPVDVLMFDDGLAAAGPLGVRTRAVDPYDAAPAGPAGPHGDRMAALIRQVTGLGSAVRVFAWRVVDATGRGTTHDLAAALIDALHVQARDQPALINLSIGWPAGLNTPRLIWTETARPDSPYACGSPDAEDPGAVFEDAAGEAVRHLLAQAEAQGIATFAAAGNRPGRPAFQRPTPVEDYGAPFVTDACLSKLPNPTPWFFPGEWGYTPGSCTVAGGAVGGQRYPVVAVSGTDAFDQPARGTLAETPLVAPGMQVYAGFDGQPPIVPGALVTGSSAATALTSAVAARLQARRLAAGQPALAPQTLARLLWLTGEAVGRTGRALLNLPPVRRLSLCQAEATLACADAACPGGGLVACLERPELAVYPTPFTPVVLDGNPGAPGCAPCFAACLAAAEVDCAGDVAPPAPAEAGLARLATCFGGDCPLPEGAMDDGAPLLIESAALDAPPLPFEVDDDERLADAYELGGLGPQPIAPICPDCLMIVDFPGGAGTLHVRLDPALLGSSPPLATLQTAYVVVQHAAGVTWVPVYGPGVATGWTAGTYIRVDDLAFGSVLATPAAWSGAHASFVAKIKIEQGKQVGQIYLDESPLLLKVYGP
ncbi:MAG: S8/S53 family peptidase [Myxococcales bacterium]|nr:S8/S53 family peptidase [Myxococcales bacterium]